MEAMLLRLPRVKERTGFRKSHIYELIRRGDFPAPVRIGARAVAWDATACADPETTLTSFRALVAEREAIAPPAPEGDPWMRTCRRCTNLSPGGRCLTAWRGESFGNGFAVRRDFAPLDPDRPQRYLPYLPGPDDPDPWSGVERWPCLTAPCATSR